MAVEANMENPKPAEDISAQGLLAQKALEQLRRSHWSTQGPAVLPIETGQVTGQVSETHEQLEDPRRAVLRREAFEEVAGGIGGTGATDAERAAAIEEQELALPASGRHGRSRSRIRRPTRGEFKQALGIGLKHWAENLNPKNIVDKDWLWRTGFGFGVAESVAFTALPLPLKGFAKAGLNLAITQGTHIVLNLPRVREEARVQKQYAGFQPTIIDEEMARIAEKYSRAHQRIKDFALGLSAGAMYMSLGSAVYEVGKEALGWDMQKALQEGFEVGKGAPPATGGAAPTETPTGTPAPKTAGLVGGEAPKMPAATMAPGPTVEATATPTPAAGPGGLPGGNLEAVTTPTAEPTATPIPTATPTPEISPSPLPTATPTETPTATATALPIATSTPTEVPTATLTQAAKEEAIKAIANNPNYALEKAAEVGKVLPNMQDTIVQQVLEQNNGSLSGLDAAALEKAHQAIQHALEEKANTFFDNNLNANPSAGLQGVAEAGRTSFESWLAQDATHQQLAEIAQAAINEQAQVTEVLTQNVSSALEAAPNLFTDQAIAHGTTVGQMLQDAGYQVSWTGVDAPMLGAHIAANHDTLTEMWQQMAAHQNIPESPFPVGMTEIADLVEKAKTGDKEALRRLLTALRYIPAGQKFKILNKGGISAVLATLG